MVNTRTPSITEKELGITSRRSTDPIVASAQREGVSARDGTGLTRTNTGRVLQPGEARKAPPANNTTTEEPLANPMDNVQPQQFQPGVQKAGVNWLLPLLIIGGFVAAAKLKKKKVTPKAGTKS